MAGPRRCRLTRQHIDLRLRGGNRALCRPGRGSGQGRHQRRSARLQSGGDTETAGALGALYALARRFGVHIGAAVSRAVADADEATALMRRLRASPPSRLAGFASNTTDLLQRPGLDRTDALIFAGGDAAASARVVVRPSGTEPKVKCYIEVRSAVV